MATKLPLIEINQGMTKMLKNRISSSNLKESDILTPMNSHLQNIDAKRAILVFDTAITKVLLSSAIPALVKYLPTNALLIGKEANCLFEEYGPLAAEYNEICEAMEQLSNRSESRNITQSISSQIPTDSQRIHNDLLHLIHRRDAIRPKLEDLTKEIIRSLIQNPIATEALIRHSKQWRIERREGIRYLASLLSQLRSLIYNELLMTPTERAKRSEYLECAERRFKEQTRLLGELKIQYNELSNNYENTIKAKRIEIENLQKNLMDLELITKNNIREFKEEFEKRYRITKDKSHINLKLLNNDLTATADQLSNLLEVNKSKELSLRQKRWKMEDEIENLVKKSEGELFTLQEDINTLTNEYNTEKKEYDDLLKVYIPLKAEYDQIMDDKRKEEERVAKMNEDKMQLIKSATIIQSFWRSWKTRKLIKNQRGARRKRKI